jgi:RNA methyltransferase, TrmH family
VEGPTLLAEALAAGAPVESVFVAPGFAPEVDAGVRVYELEPGVLERVAGTVTPQPVLAIVGMVGRQLADLRGPGPLVICVDVRDPGNLGTVLRSAEAAGAAGVLCCDGTVDVYNPKTVRASAGALFHVPFVAGGAAVSSLEEARATGRRVLGAAARRGEPVYDVDVAGPVAFVLGNEAAGLSPEVAARVDGFVHIPIEGRSESLNVGMACAVLCFEAARQRRLLVGVGS